MILNKQAMKRWRCRPFIAGVVTPSNRSRTVVNECRCCAHCGSVTIIGGDLLRQSKQQANFFCDIQCAGEFKRWHNRTDEYRAKWKATRAVSEFGLAVEEKSKQKHIEHELAFMKRSELKANQKAEKEKASWRCCSWCDVAFMCTQNTIFCSPMCAAKRMRVLRKLGIVSFKKYKINCERCGKFYEAEQSIARFCSERCRKRTSEKNREHIKRSRAFGQSTLAISELMKKHKSKCVNCGVKCILPDGRNAGNEATEDHIVPISRGGLHIQSNIQLMCRQCNTIKNASLDYGVQLMLGLT